MVNNARHLSLTRNRIWTVWWKVLCWWEAPVPPEIWPWVTDQLCSNLFMLVAVCPSVGFHSILDQLTLDFDFISPPIWERSTAMRASVCLCVCVSVREHISGTTRLTFTKFSYMLRIAVARSLWLHCDILCTCFFSDEVTVCLHIMARNKRRDKGVHSN